ncbi:MAG: hypothetical protein ACFFDN_17905 [Candidatus Hodarchaeota archaeon]
MRNNKYQLFAFMGFVSGVVGSLISEIIPMFNLFYHIFHVAVWSSVYTIAIALGLFWAIEIYNRKPQLNFNILKRAILSGIIAGSISGSIAQAIYLINPHSEFFRAICWGLMGALVGWRLSHSIPNLGVKKGIFAGSIGGLAGGFLFVLIITSKILPQFIGRFLGIGILGLALGLALVIVEVLFREAYLEIIWNKYEKTSISLGLKPVTIGGKNDDIYVKDLPSESVIVSFNKGKINYLESATKRNLELKDGSKITIGRIEIVVHANT